MDFSSVASIRDAGFEGFLSAAQLRRSQLAEVPARPGVYLVLVEGGLDPEFQEVGTGGYFKGRNPNVHVSLLHENWVTEAIVAYIGKAGGAGSAATLRRRIGTYLKFGEGRAAGHSGGRYIWQLPSPDSLTFCWMVTGSEPRDVERELIGQFCERYGKRPFANLKH